MKKVENHHGLGKNESGAVVITDKKKYEAAKARKAEKNRVQDLENKVRYLESLMERLLNEVGK